MRLELNDKLQLQVFQGLLVNLDKELQILLRDSGFKTRLEELETKRNAFLEDLKQKYDLRPSDSVDIETGEITKAGAEGSLPLVQQ